MRKTNRDHAPIFPLPKALQQEPLIIQGMDGKGKMGKSSPDGALFLSDSDQQIHEKIKRAVTAIPGQITPVLESHILLARSLTRSPEQIQAIDDMKKAHLAGNKIMGEFKATLAELVITLLTEYRTRRAHFEANPSEVQKVLERGRQLACTNAKATMELVQRAMYGVDINK